MISLPWPDRSLHPNSRVDRRRATPARAKARMDGLLLARQYIKAGGIKTDHLILTFHPPDMRRRDIDGAFSACKSALDGISQALERDDSNWSFTLRWGAIDKYGGRVDVVFAIDPGVLPVAGWVS